jgi:predicted DNA-binding transcriptional regulator AlpA
MSISTQQFTPADRMLTRAQVAEIYAVSPRTVFKWEAAGKIPRRLDKWTGDARWLESEVVAHVRSMRGQAVAS